MTHHSDAAPDRPVDPTRRLALGGALGAATAAVVGARAANAQDAAPTGHLSGKTAFVTGGARGIGLASAEAMARAGANVVLFDIATADLPNVQYPLSSEADLATAQAAVEAHGVECMSYQGDVRNLADQQDAMRQAVDRFGSLDVVLANAGVSRAGPIEDATADDLSILFETNVNGYVKTTQAAVPHLRDAGGGRIIYVSSGLARTGNDIFGLYGSTKWAINGFAKSAAIAYGRDGITCNVIAPGLVNTPFADNEAVLGYMMPGAENPTFAEVSAAIAQGAPLGVGHLEPEEVAESVMFFTGDATRTMTGEVLDVSYGSAATSIG
ncbi:SDR family NAD(P)-dependent oxidoreductase [Jannaschia sp. LMIT008]|uniref:SDR family NAD(P)-dependent oxidoreductase n=1 Tax=Jannaschia maritima TaxID=3032585 RepID=UPI002810A3FB|nr:SDR family NAD(P)-dependent oxidoreductase [Jannaschia sp. LMIT008]